MSAAASGRRPKEKVTIHIELPPPTCGWRLLSKGANPREPAWLYRAATRTERKSQENNKNVRGPAAVGKAKRAFVYQ